MTRFVLLFLILSVLAACSKQDSNKEQFIHIAHTRLYDTISQKIDPLAEKLDYDSYDVVMLGGDITEETSKKRSTLEYVDGLFDLDKPSTLWALGNHDNEDLETLQEFTKRPYTYSYHRRGITYVVLYTQQEIDWKCHITGDQLELIQGVCDTIQESSHLIVLTHKLVWIMDNPELKEHQGKDFYDWSCNYRIHKTNWNDDILPRLRDVQKSGTQVICLAGDIGNNVKTFEEHTSDGLVYLASGIHAGDPKSEVLLFEHDLKERKLRWSFAKLNELSNKPAYRERIFKAMNQQ